MLLEQGRDGPADGLGTGDSFTVTEAAERFELGGWKLDDGPHDDVII
jgi:hypothetical protein